MNTIQRNVTGQDAFQALVKAVYYFLILPSALVLAAMTLIIFLNDSFHYHLRPSDYILLTILYAVIIIPLGLRFYNVSARRQRLEKMVAQLSREDRFCPQAQHQILDAARGKYLGVDTRHGTILYIHMLREGVIDIIALTMADWTNCQQEESWLRIYTRQPDIPVLSIHTHQDIARRLFDTLGAMSSNSYSEPFPQEPWTEYVGRQSNFVEYQYNVTVPQAVKA
ncbi:hypothetical protein V462_10490 [Pantoea ananatis 15320]|uniref:plasmid IncI1-type surface exclusion protein ExcA n=1 Tax=Pantoea ananas TaxID=553 RepID=UPI000407B733|nr:plasmid IncI1-type surface exclusion protein ExcA [Pantoea ananatis]PKC36334.1 hypothetical protein V462_10490 [Pantoea ananatis 15320]